MSNMIKISGQGLQRRYGNGSGSSGVLSDSARAQQKADHDALRKASRAKREAREKRAEDRQRRLDNNNPEVALKKLEENPEQDLNVKQIQDEALGKTNALARKYGLKEPNNPEALKHDRLHCMACDRKLDRPAVGQFSSEKSLFSEEDVRLLCCWCFGNMSDADIRNTAKVDIEADSEIRLKVYNPLESTKKEVESLIESKMIQMRSKLKRWKQDVALVGNLKHDYLQEGDDFENIVRNQAKTRYNACTL